MSSPTMNVLWSSYQSHDDPANTAKTKTVVLTYTKRPIPSPTKGQVLVKLRATGVNPSDVANALSDRFKGGKPLVPGRDFAGTIIEAPDDPSLVGSAVYGSSGNWLSLHANGTHAEYV